jgi:hypothetical protein
VFESESRLREEVAGLLTGIRERAEARYVCIAEPGGVRFEAAEPSGTPWPSRQYLEQRLGALFTIPASLAAGGPVEDVFAEWHSPAGTPEDEFFLAFINGRVVLVVVCPEAEPLREDLKKLIQALADRLFRLNAAWRVDEKGRGLFFGRPRLDLVVIGRRAD